MNPVRQMNISAVHIASGDYDKAIEGLTASLKDLKLFIHEEVASSEATSHDAELEFLRLPNATSSFLDAGKQGKKVLIFQDPIVARWTWGAAEFEELSYISLFNLALAYHLKFVEEGSKEHETDRDLLNKAACIYEYAHSVLMNQKFHAPAIHLMAITCNLAHIHCILGNGEKEEACLQHLLSGLMFVVESGRGEQELGNSLDDFLKIVSPIISKTPTAPAA
mmetsp:Transcript_26891/g.44305  ORF Transcript_26891/g.44305 Transcript_26891/m.44305 type:complete len:222 (-) Transcript_26891:316-981(-)